MTLRDRLRALHPIFQLHWLLGITAGSVLVVVGVTGGLMSFQQDILEWLNPATVERLSADTPRLSPPELVARYHEAHPEHRVSSLFWRQDRPYPLLIGYDTPESTDQRGGRALLDPYTAEPMAQPRGQWTFGLIRQLHERLAAGRTGQIIVGIATITLVVLSISGLYLRWQRRPRQGWRWLWPRALGGKLAGEWHAVLGVWALVAYLLASLTGLIWSFDWYRDGANALFASGETAAHPSLEAPVADPDLERIWAGIAPEMADALSVFIRLPDEPSATVDVHYVPGDAQHRFADSELFVHPGTGEILGRESFAELGFGDKLLASAYALHMGAFFGTPGVVFMMLASLAMPVFFVTGWLLYLRRRRMKRQVAAPTRRAVDAAPGEQTVLVAYASQSGLAQRIATQTANTLQQGGRAVRMADLGALTPTCLRAHRRALFVVSTHGEGDAPVAARHFDRRFCHAGEPRLEQLDYALLCLGDSDYADSYCAFGRRLDRSLRERGARTLLTPIEVDKADQHALARWHAALAGLFGVAAARAEPAFSRWRLAERAVLNPASLGTPTAWLRLTCDEAPPAEWRAGDIAEIRPHHAGARVAAWLDRHGLDPCAMVVRGHVAMNLQDALADRQLPETADADARADLQAWYDGLPPLAARDYSIANIDAGRGIELVVRLACHDGGTGVASGWLIEHAALGAAVDVRLRANPGFRADADALARPALLIGNGTGIAGLRAHLQARIAAGRHDSWLIFGERQRARDFYFAEELTDQEREGRLRLDPVFSRDGETRRHVQHRLAEQADVVREWLAAGAIVYVCGSHEGMAPGVTAALAEIVGDAGLDRLHAEGRIRMDVY